ncbi:MAG: isopentenyl-diphosphate Delta-isomerase [Gemmatimonadota bacterium]|nr:isopentenyl-diphosphate Delta-isomerase [Gemmatimonadota bacterium]
MTSPLVERVVLVDEQDHELGSAEKLAAHESGHLHRAFSVFVLDEDDRLMLQRRANGKYHSPGLWSNTCCGHPRPGEPVVDAAQRRLFEEMGFACPLGFEFSFLYRAELGNGLTEHELDHVLTGRFSGEPRPDPSEVGAWRVASVAEVQAELASDPAAYSAWFPLAFQGLIDRGWPRPTD